MFKGSISGWLVAIVFLGVMVGIAGGGVVGGVAGYYAALRSRACQPARGDCAVDLGATAGPVGSKFDSQRYREFGGD